MEEDERIPVGLDTNGGETVPRDDGYGDFRELLLLQSAGSGALMAAGAVGLLPFVVAGAVVVTLVPDPFPTWSAVAVVAYGLVAGAATAWTYRRGHIPYRRGDFAAAATLTLALTPALLVALHAAGQGWAVGLAIVGSVVPSLLLEVAWKPLFSLALRRFAGLHLDPLIHESLRERYGDDWQAYLARISADLREARRLKEQGERDAATKD